MTPDQVKVGDELYVNTRLYLDRGEDDTCGGIAVVERVDHRPVPGNPVNSYFVYFEGLPNGYNLTLLLEDQDKLAAEFGDRIAHHCPDIEGHVCPNLMRRTRESILAIVGKDATVS